VLTLEAKALTFKQECEELRQKLQKEAERQARLKAQLEVLRDGGPEGETRLRIVRELDESHRSLNENDAKVNVLMQQSALVYAQAREALNAVLKAHP
jgi:septation ring formation regulator EzrA